MIIAVLIVFGLCLGSFVNALVWRVREQATEVGRKKPRKDYLKDLSISKGRSMCPDCHNTLAAKDLVPVFSWLSLKGKCRYCRKPISAQYPIVEAITAALFVASYVWWPVPINRPIMDAIFVFWLLILTGFMALIVYDLKWMLLPDRIMLPLTALALVMAGLVVANNSNPKQTIIHKLLAVAVGGGIFYVLFQISQGKWIGGGDVKLGWLLGLIVGTPAKALLFIFIAALAGSVISVPMLASGKMGRTSTIPFGPFLIIGGIVTMLFGQDLLNWYHHLFYL